MQGNLNPFYLISIGMLNVQQVGGKILDHLYSTHRAAYKGLPRPLFAKSDHTSILLIPAYKLKLMQEAPVTRSINKWSDKADANIHNCFASTDWNMFQDSSYGIEEYTTSVTGFINKCIEDVVPNQKPGIIANIHNELKCIAADFNERDSNPEACKKSRFAL
jgi:hypothetical protein